MALKVMDKNLLDDQALDAIYNELSIHRFINHSNIVKYQYSYESENEL